MSISLSSQTQLSRIPHLLQLTKPRGVSLIVFTAVIGMFLAVPAGRLVPPVLGWAAVTGEVASDALLLFLIIFAWTPPHFWALALYRKNEYAKAGVPMLPITHGDRFTRLHVLFYTVILVAVTALPFASRM